MKKLLIFILMLSLSFALLNAAVDTKLSVYTKVSGVSGDLSSIGSDTLNNLMTYWSEGYKKSYPGIKFQVEGKGSSTAPPALIEGTANFGPMSRTMKDSEIDEFTKKYGYKPTAMIVAIDSLGVYVHKNNPLTKITFKEIDSIFSKTRSYGGTDIGTWGALGLKGQWSNRPISLYGRNSASGTYGYFKEHALKKGDFKDIVKEQPGSASVVQGVENDQYAIGYSGIGYKTSGVKALSLSMDGTNYFEATLDNALSGKYPLARPLLIYINKKPGEKLDPKIAEFFKYILSKEGQEIVEKDGYFPIPATVTEKELAKLN